MDITINPDRVIYGLLSVGVYVGIALMLYVEIRRSRMIRSFRKRWVGFGDTEREFSRSHRLFLNPIREHNALYPGDIQAGLIFCKLNDTVSVGCFWPIDTEPHKWSEGSGLEVIRMLASGIAKMERRSSGCIPILQVMLDEERDRIKSEATNNIIR